MPLLERFEVLIYRGRSEAPSLASLGGPGGWVRTPTGASLITRAAAFTHRRTMPFSAVMSSS